MHDWPVARVAARRRLTDSLFRLSLEVPPEVASSFRIPGQYHRIAVEGLGDSPFAIASGPGQSPFEYVVKRGSGVSDALSTLSPGQLVRVSQAKGPGFPVDDGRGHPVLLVGTGTGFAPLRAVLLARQSGFTALTAVYGARDEASLAFAEDFPAWRAAGVTVLPVLSRPGPGWAGATGRVQAVVGALRLAPDTHVYVVGQAEMVADVRRLLQEAGVPAGNVHLNH